ATAESVGIPETFNAATYFVDRNVSDGRGSRVAIECGDEIVTYDEVLRKVNRFGSALLRLGVRPEERVLLLLHDGPDFVSGFFGGGILGIRSADRTFSVAKLFFAYGLGNALYFPFSVGATTILFPGPPTPQNVYAVIEKHRPTLFYSVPTGYAMMLAHPSTGSGQARGGGTQVGPDFDLSSIRLAVSAGEALPPAIYERFKQRFGVDVIDGIGSTETLHMFISNRPGAIRLGSSGRIVDG